MPKKYEYLHTEDWFKFDASMQSNRPLDAAPLFLPLTVRVATISYPGWKLTGPKGFLTPVTWKYVHNEN